MTETTKSLPNMPTEEMIEAAMKEGLSRFDAVHAYIAMYEAYNGK